MHGRAPRSIRLKWAPPGQATPRAAKRPEAMCCNSEIAAIGKKSALFESFFAQLSFRTGGSANLLNFKTNKQFPASV
jgi:hypothetical protein